jgi:hypothetical protein
MAAGREWSVGDACNLTVISEIASYRGQTAGGVEAIASVAYWEQSLFRRVIDSVPAEWRGILFDPVQ